MSRLGARVNRLWKATHTFIKGSDWKMMADYWKAKLDDANVKPEDFEVESTEILLALIEMDREDGEERWADKAQEFSEKNYLAYCTFMYKNACNMARWCPNGYWVGNDQTGLFTNIGRATQWVKLQQGK